MLLYQFLSLLRYRFGLLNFICYFSTYSGCFFEIACMHIVHIAAELAPIAKVGGLGDVIYGLSRETNRQRHKATVILPKYDSLELGEIEDLQLLIKSFPCAFGKTISTSSIWSGKVGGISVYFIDL